MEIAEIKIIESGVTLKIKAIINGMAFYSAYSFDSVKQAEAVLKAYGLMETK